MCKKSEPYRPSNGCEGDWFMSQFCEQCAIANLDDDADDLPCSILGRALGYSIDDPEYPKEWVQDEHGKRCTAFVAEGDEVPYRCENTIDMFSSENNS